MTVGINPDNNITYAIRDNGGKVCFVLVHQEKCLRNIGLMAFVLSLL